MKALLPTGSNRSLVRVAEIDEPDPADDEAVVAVLAFSVNRGETFQLEKPPDPGWRPGKDVAGVVVRAARGGRGPAPGTRVVAHPTAGGWAERVAVAVDRIAVLPDPVTFEVAAALPLAGLTALRLLRVLGPVSSQRILLTGASGGVGHYFVELAAAQGALVTAVTATPGRGRRLCELGAAEVIGSLADAVGPFDVGLDSVGGDSTPAVLTRLRDDGRLVWFGQASRAAPTIDFFDWSGGANATIRKFVYWVSAVPDGEDLATLVRLTASGRLHPEVGLVSDWSQTDAALDALRHRSVVGNAVLTIESDLSGRTTR